MHIQKHIQSSILYGIAKGDNMFLSIHTAWILLLICHKMVFQHMYRNVA